MSENPMKQAAMTDVQLAPTIVASCASIEAIARDCSVLGLQARGPFERAFILAAGMERLRAIISEEMMSPIMALQGSSLGFRTDKDREQGYGWETVRECLIEATLRGWYPVNNEWNIIAGRTYGTRNGLARNIAEYPGLKNLRRTFGVPRIAQSGGGAIVMHEAAWQLNGVEDSIKGELAIRVNSGQGVDVILGKAHRKQSALILDRITGSVQGVDGEIDDLDVRFRERAEVDVAATLGRATETTTRPGGTAETAPQPNPPAPQPAAELPTPAGSAARPAEVPSSELLPELSQAESLILELSEKVGCREAEARAALEPFCRKIYDAPLDGLDAKQATGLRALIRKGAVPLERPAEPTRPTRRRA